MRVFLIPIQSAFVMNTVLLVEDNALQQKVIARFLKANGLRVDTANDGVEALNQIQNSPPDLVVLDIVMPRMNGYEFCRRLQADPKTRNLPIVICSSKDEVYDRYWGMKQGARAYISKPFDPKELISTINYILKNTGLIY
jgi:twitching motility two-component system response regulator PilH